MAASLATLPDVEDLWRPLTSDERGRVDRLIVKASALLRQKLPGIDQRMELTPDDRRYLHPAVVADVVASAVKLYLDNPSGLQAGSSTRGPFSEQQTFGTPTTPRGELDFSPSLLARLHPVVSLTDALKPIRTSPNLAPWPLGRYGGPNRWGSDYPDPVHPTYQQQ